MGTCCSLPKHVAGAAVANGHMTSDWHLGKSPKIGVADAKHPLDELLALNEHQLHLLKHSFKQLAPNMMEFGITMYHTLFKRSQEIQRLFLKTDKSMALKDLANNSTFRNHVRRFMFSFHAAFEAAVAHKRDELDKILQDIGREHAIRTDLKKEYFTTILEAIMESLGNFFGRHFTPELEGVYLRLLKMVVCRVEFGYNQAKGELDEQSAREGGGDANDCTHCTTAYSISNGSAANEHAASPKSLLSPCPMVVQVTPAPCPAS